MIDNAISAHISKLSPCDYTKYWAGFQSETQKEMADVLMNLMSQKLNLMLFQ
jgi:hypothetical protein